MKQWLFALTMAGVVALPHVRQAHALSRGRQMTTVDGTDTLKLPEPVGDAPTGGSTVTDSTLGAATTPPAGPPPPVGAVAQAPKRAPSLRALGFKPGTVSVGGVIEFRFDHYLPDRADNAIDVSNLGVAPSIGYFLVENLVLTGTVVLQRGKRSMEDSSGDENSQTMVGYGLQVGVRYYIPNGNFYWYVGATAAYVLVNVTETPGDDETDGSMLEFGGAGGILYMARPWLGLEMGVKVSYVLQKMEFANDAMNYTLTDETSGLHLSLGYFGLRAFF